MTSIFTVPPRFNILLRTFGFVLVYLTALRILFYLVFYQVFSGLSAELTLRSFLMGFRFDLRLTVLVWLPFLLLSWLPYLKLADEARKVNPFWKIYWLMILLIITFAHAVDLGYFGYLGTRLDASIIGLAKDFLISMEMVWETYSIVPSVLVFIALTWLMNKVLTRWLLPSVPHRTPKWKFFKRSVLYTLTFILALGMGYGRWSRYPLRWSDAFFTPNDTACQLAINPVLFFANTYSRRSENWDPEKVSKAYQQHSDYFDFAGNGDLEFKRYILPDSTSNQSPNVIIFILETLPTYKMGSYGNEMDASPYMDSIAANSLHFRNFYVPKFSTAASVFSAMTGLPDVSVINKSSTRDPLAVNQHFIMNELEGYQKYFFIGGSANWGDIGGFFRNNVEGIIVKEEGDYDVPEVNAWGISDYHLLQDIHQTLSRESKPFIAVTLTAGHHPPFTIPDDTGFQRAPFNAKVKQAGFQDEREYNSFRFMDYAIGSFFKSAANSEYHENTLYVILGDHGFGDASIPARQGGLSLQYYHVPLMLYGPGLDLKSRNIFRTMSEIDIMPTIMGLIGKPYTNTGMGRDILNIPDSISTHAFTFTASSSSYGLISDDYYLVKNSYGPIDVFQLDSMKKVDIWNTEIDKMHELSTTYYELSRYLRYNNRRLGTKIEYE